MARRDFTQLDLKSISKSAGEKHSVQTLRPFVEGVAQWVLQKHSTAADEGHDRARWGEGAASDHGPNGARMESYRRFVHNVKQVHSLFFKWTL